MKKLIALTALLVTFPSLASWGVNDNGLPVLESFTHNGRFAAYQKHNDKGYILIGQKGVECSPGANAILDVNRKPVRFVYICQNGYAFLKPKSEAGRKYVLDRFLGQSTVNVEGAKFTSFGLEEFIIQDEERRKEAL